MGFRHLRLCMHEFEEDEEKRSACVEVDESVVECMLAFSGESSDGRYGFPIFDSSTFRFDWKRIKILIDKLND